MKTVVVHGKGQYARMLNGETNKAKTTACSHICSRSSNSLGKIPTSQIIYRCQLWYFVRAIFTKVQVLGVCVLRYRKASLSSLEIGR